MKVPSNPQWSQVMHLAKVPHFSAVYVLNPPGMVSTLKAVALDDICGYLQDHQWTLTFGDVKKKNHLYVTVSV